MVHSLDLVPELRGSAEPLFGAPRQPRTCSARRSNTPNRQIAQVLALTEANARQLVTRARGHLFSDRRNHVSAGEPGQFVDAFVAAAQSGNLAGLEQPLAAHIAGASTLPPGLAA